MLAVVVVLLLTPERTLLTRAGLVGGTVGLVATSLFLFWRKKVLRWTIIAVVAAVAILFCLPGRPANADSLREANVRGLRQFLGVRYVWGGETPLGIDCSGLVREGIVRGELMEGLRTLNGGLLREAAWIWWNDCSARELGQGYRGRTRLMFRAASINGLDHGRLRPATSPSRPTALIRSPTSARASGSRPYPATTLSSSAPDRRVFYFNIPMDILCWRQCDQSNPQVTQMKRR